MDLRRGLALLALLGLWIAGCGRAENSLLLLDSLPDVASIDIEGNEHFDDGTLKSVMTLRGPSLLNPFREHKYRKGQLDTDIRAILTFYMRHGYLRARLTGRQVRRDGDDVHISLRFEEGAPVTVEEVVIEGAHALNPNDLRKKLALERNKPMDPFKLENDRRLILQSLAEKGYWEASVKADVQFFDNRALVFYLLHEGRPVTVKDVAVSGTHQVRSYLATREISVKTGRILRLSDLNKSQIRLVQSGYFADAQWDTTALDTLNNTVGVNFRVRERRLHWTEAGVGLTSQEQIRVTGEWGSRNFVGTGMRFAVNSRTELDFTDRLPSILNDHRTEVILNQPHLFGTRWEGQPSVFYLRDNEYIEDIKAGYGQDVVGAGVSTRRRFGDLRNQVVLSLENRWVHNDADSAARYNDPQLYRNSYQTRLITLRVERDTRNDFFSPTGGTYETVTLESAGGALGGNNAFRKGTMALMGFDAAPVDHWVLAGRLQVGLINPSSGASTLFGRPVTSRVELIPAEDRYRLGGSNTVRGYYQDELDGTTAPDQSVGGLTELLANMELRMPMFWRLSMVGFLDAGNVWQNRTFLSWKRFVPHTDPGRVSYYDVRYSYGAGIRLATPVGPIRIDYARKWNIPEGAGERKDRWHVALGQAF